MVFKLNILKGYSHWISPIWMWCNKCTIRVLNPSFGINFSENCMVCHFRCIYFFHAPHSCAKNNLIGEKLRYWSSSWSKDQWTYIETKLCIHVLYMVYNWQIVMDWQLLQGGRSYNNASSHVLVEGADHRRSTPAQSGCPSWGASHCPSERKAWLSILWQLRQE